MKVIPSLNGLRAFSILIVIFSHLLENEKLSFDPSFFRLFLNGQFGVNVFFILSGFLITTLLINEYEKSGTISLRNFFIRRSIRIFPAYYFLLFCYLILQLTGYIKLSTIDWISSLTYTRQFFRVDWLCAHFWSLSVEEFFYLIFPFFFLFVNKKAKRFNNLLLISVLIIFPVCRICGHFIIPNTSGYNIFYRGDALLIGCLLAVNYEQVKRFVGGLRLSPITILILLCLYQYIDKLNLTSWINIVLGNPGVSLIDNFLICLLIVKCIENRKTLYFRILNSHILNHIGILSYSLYLWQQIFTSRDYFPVLTSLPLNIILLTAVSLLSYYLVEKPFFKLKSRFNSESSPVSFARESSFSSSSSFKVEIK